MTRFLGFAGLALSVAAGGATLLFMVEPDFKPCIGGAEATFSGAPVFPHVSYKQHLKNIDTPPGDVDSEPRTDVGAEVRLSFRIANLRGDLVEVRYSLVNVERDDTLGRVDSQQNRELAEGWQSEACSEVLGSDLFVRIPTGAKRRYRVVLELYRGEDLDERIALTQTEVFSG